MIVTPAEFCNSIDILNAGATAADIAAVERSLDVSLPNELRRMLEYSDGFEGFVGPRRSFYLVIDSTARLAEQGTDPAYKFQWPDLVQFGGDGGGEGFFFDPTRPGPPVLMVALVGDWRKDSRAVAD
ncbi:MAG: SMI1/KNR4 family protein [Phycisphaerales bacterium]|nr:SMI1/KNR4 family protein [Phycisphaerales bacterium]